MSKIETINLFGMNPIYASNISANNRVTRLCANFNYSDNQKIRVVATPYNVQIQYDKDTDGRHLYDLSSVLFSIPELQEGEAINLDDSFFSEGIRYIPTKVLSLNKTFPLIMQKTSSLENLKGRSIDLELMNADLSGAKEANKYIEERDLPKLVFGDDFSESYLKNLARANIILFLYNERRDFLEETVKKSTQEVIKKECHSDGIYNPSIVEEITKRVIENKFDIYLSEIIEHSADSILLDNVGDWLILPDDLK